MNEDQPKKPSDADADLEREIRADRKFSLTEAIGRMAGGGAMKGVSPVTGKRQAELEIGEYLNRHLIDAAGALGVVLLRRVRESAILLAKYDQPLTALACCIQHLLDSDALLKDFVCEVDVEWGRIYDERPYFEREGFPPDPDDPYTTESVRLALSRLIAKLGDEQTGRSG
jgi:hypothetical protein